MPSCLRSLTSLWRTRGCRGDSQFKSLALSFTYVILLVVLLLLIWLKLLTWLVPVDFRSGCVRWSILLFGEGIARVAKAIEYLEVEL